MPRSFLVKKVKLDDFPAGLDAPYGRTRADFGARLHDKGKYRRRCGGRGGVVVGEPGPGAFRRAARCHRPGRAGPSRAE